MFCPHCGKPNAAGIQRCVACGNAMPVTNTPNIAASATGVGVADSSFTGAFPPIDSNALTAVSEAGRPGTAPGATAAGNPFNVLAAGQTFSNRYHIIRLLGAGGMGAVYQAWDAELGVSVALKVIRPDVSADSTTAAALERRFKRELLLARQVSHKHVVRIHDLGDVEGVKYITMAYVQGADLASVLRQAGKLPVNRALHYARQIAAGLAAAHEVGVVHRDLKPANIMVDEDDHAVIMDFGIARSGSGTGSGSGIVGTLDYMAPEQAQAKPTDQRADIYAFGMIFREMLVGRRVIADGSSVADLLQRITEPLPHARTLDATIPEPVDAFIARCVEPDPAKRFQTTVDLVAALGELNEDGHRVAQPPQPLSWKARGAIAAAVVALATGAAFLTPRSAPAVPDAPPPSVSVLVADFDNQTNDASFDGALEQPFVLALEGAPFLDPFPRRDALQVARSLNSTSKLDQETARLIAVREGVKYLVAGSVAASGGGYSLEARAIDPSNGTVLQSATATSRSKTDVLAAVATLASGIRDALGDNTADNPSPAAMETFTAGSLDAMREYSAAQDLMFASEDEAALGRYQKALELDPKFGRAYSGAALSANRLGRREEAEAFWKQALALTDRMTEREKYRTLGAYYLDVARNYEKAVENYAALVSAYPADSAGHNNLALAYFYLQDFQKALEEGRRALELYPKNAFYLNNAALYAMYAGDFAQGVNQAKSVLGVQPSTHKAYLPLAIQAVFDGKPPEAINAYAAMQKTGAPGASLAAIGLADLDLHRGQVDTIEPALRDAIAADVAAKRTRGAALKHIVVAEAHALAGRRAPAAAAAKEALGLSRQVETLVPAARVFIRIGNQAEAKAIAAELEGQLQRQSRAYAKIIQAELALDAGRHVEAVDRLMESRQMADLWLGRFDLGVAYVLAGHFAEAISELELCEKRRGEVTAAFFDDVPTVRYAAPVPYWMGRAREGLGQKDAAAERYKAFLALRPSPSPDPLALDARKRLGTP
jgi:tetratricopeptide (TPR) repeat protein